MVVMKRINVSSEDYVTRKRRTRIYTMAPLYILTLCSIAWPLRMIVLTTVYSQ